MSELELLVELDGVPEAAEREWLLQGVGGVVVDPAAGVGPEALDDLEPETTLIRGHDPERFGAWRERPSLRWVADTGLEETARLRDRWPELAWLPRIAVYRREGRYHFDPTSLGEGFRCYVPDTGAINGYLTVTGEQRMEGVLRHAAELGFDTLWLHGAHAEAAGTGLDLELLERAGRCFQGGIWFSGGARDEQHLFNLARQGGAAGVIVPARLPRECGCDRLRLALESGGDDAVPLTLEPHRARA